MCAVRSYVFWVLSALAVSVLATACGSGAAGSPGGVCHPGDTQSCVGPANCQGVRQCLVGGRGYSDCSCATGSGGTGGADSGTSGGSGGAAGNAGASGATGSGGSGGGAGASACDPAAAPAQDGVFVSQAWGNDTLGDGSAGSPYATVQKGVDTAIALKRGKVYVDHGTYNEQVRLLGPTVPMQISGAWERTASGWVADCSAAAAAKTVIDSPKGVAVQVAGVTNPARLDTLTIKTPAQCTQSPALPGGSCIGVIVSGDNNRLTLSRVNVVAGNAGNGGSQGSAQNGVTTTCNGVTDCATGANGQTGAVGSMATAGSFVATGYMVGNGAKGGAGTDGANGTPGGSGNQKTCMHCGQCDASQQCSNQTPYILSSGAGTCGCAGTAGTGGSAGLGGGASVALYVYGKGAVVDVVGSQLTSGDGGDGHPGGSGGIGWQGTAGTKADDLFCIWQCLPSTFSGCVCGSPSGSNTSGWVVGGNAGSGGGKGGDGGKGGGGAGGPSHATVTAGGATIHVSSDTTLAFGNPGQGGDSAPAGAASASYDQP